MKFAGWFLDQGFTGTKYTKGESVKIGSDGLDVYAKYSDYTVKYAVILYGIEQDVDENGDTIGLTFGPATGGDYRHTYKACPDTTAESPGNCLHWMTWQEIIDQSQTDPHYFDACLENGCTHEVKLNITGELAESAKDYSGQFDDGDGAGCLYGSINSSYRKWNNERSNAGGWPASRIRATLNGQDDSTDPSVAGSDCLDSSNCLLAMFPQELRDNIVSKEVWSDTVYDDPDYSSEATYDKLWLLSGYEIYGSGSRDDVIRENEGNLYQHSEDLGITTSSNRDKLIAYKEVSRAGFWWLRSSSRDGDDLAYYVNNDGGWNYGRADRGDLCLAPGFCLPGPEKVITANYAVTIWGIDQDVDESGNTLGLTFGPAAGQEYKESWNAFCPGTSEESPGSCLHWMTWQEIIEQSKKDPHYFEACLENGCTQRVPMQISGKLAGYSGSIGACLSSPVNDAYQKWNFTDSNAGGWPASRIRATLNGKDDNTDPSVAGNDCLEASECLLSMFPKELQTGIVAKAVKSDTVQSDLESNNQTTYDKLWLPSVKETHMSSGTAYADSIIRPNEGELYQRSVNKGITTLMDGGLLCYDNNYSMAFAWWLRSPSIENGDSIYIVNGRYGGCDDSEASYPRALAPCFCLE